MIDAFFHRPAVRQRIADGLLGPHLHRLTQALQEQGYAPTTIRHSLSAGDKFGHWLVAQHLPLSTVTEATLARYLRQVGRRSKATQGLGLVICFLRQQGVAFPSVPPAALSAHNQWLSHYADYLLQVRGLAVSTRESYLRVAKRFLTFCFPADQVAWSTVMAKHLVTFVQHEAKHRQGHGRKVPAVALRALLRFVVFTGERTPGLEEAVPVPRQWRHAALPGQLAAEEVERILALNQGASPAALRNSAILLLLARLGLRAREVARLRLEDVDWTSGQLHIRPGKTHQARVLPLLPEVGSALVAYLTTARPPSTSREIFLRLHPPFRPFVRAVAISHLVHRILQRAAISPRPRLGAHLFRHTVASQLVQQGASFKAVADILGHRSLQSTGIYAKLDLATLTAVALPWAGGEQ